MAHPGSQVDRLWYFTRNSAYVLFTKMDDGVEHQQVLRNSDRPIKQIQDFWEHDYLVTQITHASNAWIVVGEQRKEPGSVEQHCAMENDWASAKAVIDQAISEGRRVQYVHYVNDNWIVLAEKLIPVGDKPFQSLHVYTKFPDRFFHEEVWSRNRRVEHCTFGQGQWVVVVADIPSFTPIQQGLIVKNEFPQQQIMDCIRDRKRIKCISWDDQEKLFGIVWEEEKGKGGYSVIMSNQYPQQQLADLKVANSVRVRQSDGVFSI